MNRMLTGDGTLVKSPAGVSALFFSIDAEHSQCIRALVAVLSASASDDRGRNSAASGSGSARTRRASACRRCRRRPSPRCRAASPVVDEVLARVHEDLRCRTGSHLRRLCWHAAPGGQAAGFASDATAYRCRPSIVKILLPAVCEGIVPRSGSRRHHFSRCTVRRQRPAPRVEADDLYLVQALVCSDEGPALGLSPDHVARAPPLEPVDRGLVTDARRTLSGAMRLNLTGRVSSRCSVEKFATREKLPDSCSSTR